MKGSNYKKAEYVGQYSNQIIYKPDQTIPANNLIHLMIKNIPKILYYKNGLSHKVYCIRNRHAFNV